jgi:hypothetical protein
MRAVCRWLGVAIASLAMASAQPAAGALPPIHHVFVIVLENHNADVTFGPSSPAPYLAHTLPQQGEFVPNYFGIGHVSMDNYVAMVSGQPPNPQTQSDCQFYTDFVGAVGADGIATGQGCVYPADVGTIANQLSDHGLTWKGYMEDMGADAARDNGTSCAHPALNARDPTQTAAANDQYATRHNPFVYFHAIIDTPACAAGDVPLSRLEPDLASAAATPNLVFITPDLCHDAHDASCADGTPGGLPAADAFLKTWVPRITGSPAFADGLLIVTFDESESDSSACCDEPTGPNTPSPGGLESGPGGGRVGAVLLSPFVTPGSTTQQAYNHYGLLRSLEDLFELPHLGYAAAPGLRPFGDDVYNRAPGALPSSPQCTTISIRTRPRRLPAGTMIVGPRVTRQSGNRILSFRAAHGARVFVNVGRRRLERRVHACHSYAIAVPARGSIDLTARTATHFEQRHVRG